ncbi:MAG: hypothetical protein Q8M78_00870 [Burkholderiaceae bacterium]|nr:hypothetical protein [Burkholderiaceae bacterium]
MSSTPPATGVSALAKTAEAAEAAGTVGLAGMAGLVNLAGSLRVVPGARPPLALQSSRRDWAARLAVGQTAAALPGLLASVFNLCSQAHHLCAQLALNAAVPGVQATLPPSHVAQRLRTETAQEHIRRMGLDWPRLLATGATPAGATRAAQAQPAHPTDLAAQAHAALPRCPLLHPAGQTDPWPATLAWLEHELLHMPATTWAHQWQAGGAGWLADWANRHTGWLAALLHAARTADDPVPLNPAEALHAHADGSNLQALAHALRTQPGFSLAPQWQGTCAHTGSWTRLNHPLPRLRPQPLTAWGLLGSRLAELVHLCLHTPNQPEPLLHGAVQTGTHQGLAWVEMARGLLVHRVELDLSTGQPTVQACNVLAPTEWNFHPHGVVAQAIARLDANLPAAEAERRVRLLMAAFDPCVPFEMAAAPTPTETTHA